MRKHFVMLAVVAMLALAAAPALAAKGGKGKSGSGKNNDATINLVMASDNDGDGQVSHGDQVSFDVYTSATDKPNVRVKCSQNGTVVYGAVTGYYDGYPWPWTQVMTLSSQNWTGGTADCVAELHYFKRTRTIVLKSLSFTVGA